SRGWGSPPCSVTFGERKASPERGDRPDYSGGFMSNELDFLAIEAVRGRLSRREFLGRAAALGLALPVATKLLSSTALAQGPQKGGDLVCGLVGGESTNSLDPALTLTQVPQIFIKCWGETLVY